MKFSAAFALVLVVGVASLLTMTRVYKAQASFLIKPAVTLPEIARQSMPSGDGTPAAHAELIRSNIRILTSPDLLGAVIKKMGVERLYPGITAAVHGSDTPEHEAIIRLAKDLRATNDSESNIVEIAVSNKDPQVAKDFAETLIEMFIAKQTEIYSAPHSDFLVKQLAEKQREMKTAQKEFQDFKQKTGIYNLDQEVTTLLGEKTSLSGYSLQAVSTSQESTTKLEADLAAAKATYRPESPVIQRLNESLSVARRNIASRQQDLNTSGHDGSALGPKIGKINARMAHLEKNRGEYTRLEENARMSEEDYKSYRRQGEEARSHEMLNKQGITRISVVDKAEVPVKSEPLKRKLLLIAVLMLAMMAGLGVVAVAEIMDEKVAYPEQITANVGLPVLASFGGVKIA